MAVHEHFADRRGTSAGEQLSRVEAWRVVLGISQTRARAFDRTPPRDHKTAVSDDLFSSGPWTGFYNYAPGDKHRMDLHLDFAGGCLSGDGNDDVGRFFIRERYDSANRECHWTKTYPGSHDFYYRGFREGKGIWGTWEIGVLAHGGFHIWPKENGRERRRSPQLRRCRSRGRERRGPENWRIGCRSRQ